MKTKSEDEILYDMGKILLKGIEDNYCQESPKFIPKEFASAPITYDEFIFLDKEKEKEWEDLDPSVKAISMRYLKKTCSKMENKLAIELLCHVINDMNKRIKRLEQEKDEMGR